jgi:folate-binding protein YgfZ
VDDGEATWLTVEPGTAPALVAFLDRMRFLLRVEVTDETAAWAVLVDAGGEHLVPREQLASWPAAAAAAGLPPELAGVWAAEALRIARGEPRLGLDTDHRTIPNEVGWVGPAVSLDKGCYRGQETVARVHTLGRPPRRLVRLHLDGSADHLPAHDDPIWLVGPDGSPLRAVGVVGSAARHYEDGPIALALVKRSVPGEATLLVRPADPAAGLPDVAAAQDLLVDPDVGLHVRPGELLGG